MPANLTPEYLRLEEELRKTSDPDEKLEILKQMLAVIPKHKGTDKLQAELKSKIAKLKKMPRKKGAATKAPDYLVEKSGEAQILLIGPPNSGKSSIVASVTKAEPDISETFFTTKKLIPGMLNFEDIQFQLVDTPAIFEGFTPKYLFHCIKLADYIFVVLGCDDDDLLEKYDYIMNKLEENKIVPINPESNETIEKKIGYEYLPLSIILNKTDIDGSEDIVELFKEYSGEKFPIIPFSGKNDKKENERLLGETIFRHQKILRVYTKVPSKPADLGHPFVLKKGMEVFDLARKIHKDLYKKFSYARVWRKGEIEGLRVSGNFKLKDKDIVEIHTK